MSLQRYYVVCWIGQRWGVVRVDRGDSRTLLISARNGGDNSGDRASAIPFITRYFYRHVLTHRHGLLCRYAGDAADLSLDFTVESDAFGARICEDLVPNGSDIPVTNANKLLYCHLMADWHLRRRLGPAAAAFSRGLAQALPPAWLGIFSPREVNLLLGGDGAGALDVEDLRRHTKYCGGYGASSRTIQLFWKAVGRMAPADRAAVLRFATSCSRAPLGGFEHLKPPFTIHKVRQGGVGARGDR